MLLLLLLELESEVDEVEMEVAVPDADDSLAAVSASHLASCFLSSDIIVAMDDKSSKDDGKEDCSCCSGSCSGSGCGADFCARLDVLMIAVVLLFPPNAGFIAIAIVD